MSGRSAVYTVVWACISSWYYGYHLAELNFPATSLTCLSPAIPPPSRLPLCLGLNPFRYSFVTAIFTAGGLVGSLSSSWLVSREGLKGGIAWTGWANLLAAALMALAPNWWALALGRFIAGISCGVAICLVPPFLSFMAKLSPELSTKSGLVGTMNQVGIVTGLFSAQLAGLLLTGSKGDIPGSWRYVVTISGVISVLQIAFGVRVPDPLEPGKSIAPEPSDPEAIFDPTIDNEDTGTTDAATSPLLPGEPTTAPTFGTSGHDTQLPLRELLSNTSLRGPTLLCAAIMSLQQFSGVNAVMFYSTPVLRPLLPASAGMLGIGITLVNAVMTLPAIFLVDRTGRRTLLLCSVAGMVLTSGLLAFGLDGHHPYLSGFAIIAFIASFSIGLGPIPFLLISELAPAPAIPALSSLALSCNWISAFFVAILFLPLRDALSSPVDSRDPLSARVGEGRVFYVFSAMGMICGALVWKGLAGRA